MSDEGGVMLSDVAQDATAQEVIPPRREKSDCPGS